MLDCQFYEGINVCMCQFYEGILCQGAPKEPPKMKIERVFAEEPIQIEK